MSWRLLGGLRASGLIVVLALTTAVAGATGDSALAAAGGTPSVNRPAHVTASPKVTASPNVTASPLATASPLTTASPQATAAIAVGAFITGAPRDASAIDAFTAQVGFKPTIVQYFQSWGSSYNAFNPDRADAVTARGATPLITWEPWVTTQGVNQPAYSLDQIAAGEYDDYVRVYASAVRQWGKRLYLRFAHEMNGNWYPWAAGVNGNTAASYRAAWRHLHAIFEAEGATNVRWVWAPNISYPGSTPFTDLYPGDDVVDWMGLDGYNRGPLEGHRWKSLEELLRSSYDAITRLSARPVMLAETSSSETGGRKADWIRDGFLALASAFPRIRAVVWFHGIGRQDWRVDTSETSLAAFREIFSADVYRNTLP